MLTDDVLGGGVHRVDVERRGNVPRTGGDQRIRVRRVPDVVAVVPPLRREASVEVVGDELDAAHGDRRRAQLVEPAGEVVEIGPVGQLDGDHLAPGVDAGVGPPSTGERHRLADDRGDRLGQRSGNGADALVDGEPVKPGAVVGDNQLDVHRHSVCVSAASPQMASHADTDARQTSSILAISARSPWRVPSLRMRV